MNIFIDISGASKEYIKHSPETEKIKYTNIGIAVFFTAILSSISMFYAIYTTIIKNKNIDFAIDKSTILVFFITLVWFFLILTIDRYIITSIGSSKNKLRQVFMALPRVFISIFIGLVIAVPLEVAIFASEIDKIIYQDKQNIIKNINNKYTNQIQTIIDNWDTKITDRKQKNKSIIDNWDKLIQMNQNLLQKLIKEKDEYSKHYFDEINGKGVTHKRGEGVKSESFLKKKNAIINRIEAIKKEIKNAIQQKVQLKKNIEQLEKDKEDKIEAKEKELKKKLSSIEQLYTTSFISRLKAFEQLKSESDIIKYAYYFILMLFVSIELTPVMIKLFSPKGVYEHIYTDKELELYEEYYKNIYKPIKLDEWNLYKKNLEKNDILAKINYPSFSIKKILNTLSKIFQITWYIKTLIVAIILGVIYFKFYYDIPIEKLGEYFKTILEFLETIKVLFFRT